MGKWFESRAERHAREKAELKARNDKKNPWRNHPSTKAHDKSRFNDEGSKAEVPRTAIIYTVTHGHTVKTRFRGTPAEVNEHIRTMRHAAGADATVIVHSWGR